MPTLQSSVQWLCCFRHWRLAGLWCECQKKALKLPAWCDASWRDLVKRRALWCREGCFECVWNILELLIKKIWLEKKAKKSFNNLRIQRSNLDYWISIQTLGHFKGHLFLRSIAHWWRLHVEYCTICYTSLTLTFILLGCKHLLCCQCDCIFKP